MGAVKVGKKAAFDPSFNAATWGDPSRVVSIVAVCHMDVCMGNRPCVEILLHLTHSSMRVICQEQLLL